MVFFQKLPTFAPSQRGVKVQCTETEIIPIEPDQGNACEGKRIKTTWSESRRMKCCTC
jgi:hypothetical protein